MPQENFKTQAEKIAIGLKDRLEDTSPHGRELKLAALSYMFVLVFIPYFSPQKSKFVKFHAHQGLMLFILQVFAGLVSWFPFFGQAFALVLFFVSVVGIAKSLNGIWWEIPFIFEWSEKYIPKKD
jgi:uncharacterized membrane protein